MIPHTSSCSPSIHNNLFISIFIMIIFVIFAAPLYMEAKRLRPTAANRDIAIFDGQDFNSSLMKGNSHKKLRKLPHVFSKVLELPFRSDADVAVEEGPDFFRFVANIKVDGGGAGGVRAHAVEIHPGVIKIVVRNGHKLSGGVELSLDSLEIDTWRFRLPSSTVPELATAAFVAGQLIVTVPKGGPRRAFVKGAEAWGRGGDKLVFVQ